MIPVGAKQASRILGPEVGVELDVTLTASAWSTVWTSNDLAPATSLTVAALFNITIPGSSSLLTGLAGIDATVYREGSNAAAIVGTGVERDDTTFNAFMFRIIASGNGALIQVNQNSGTFTNATIERNITFVEARA